MRLALEVPYTLGHGGPMGHSRMEQGSALVQNGRGGGAVKHISREQQTGSEGVAESQGM